jgi:hypothetical protein
MASKGSEGGARSRLRVAGAVLGGYAALLALFVAPAASRLASEPIASDADRDLYLWSAWWVRESLFSGETPYFTKLLYAPEGVPLVFHTLALLPSSVAAALIPTLGPALAYNVVALGLMLLAGVGGYAFCRVVVEKRGAAWLGGVVFMLAPFTSGKLDQGWINLLCVGFLALFGAALVRATDPRDAARGRARYGLAATAAALAFSSEHLSVFAALLALCVCAWRIAAEPSLATVGRLVRAGWPSVVAVAPYVAIVASYATRFELSVPARPPELSFAPEPISYLLPLHEASLHANWIGALDLPARLSKEDLACYLGLAVFPVALAGLWRQRARSEVRLCIALLAVFLVLSLGPALVVGGEYVRALGARVPLPGRALSALPVLGAVAQSGRLMALVYLALAAGVACFAAAPPERIARRFGRALLPALLALVALDYGFSVETRPLPRAPDVPRGGVVLARARVFAPPLYFQTLDRRPLVAGPVSRPVSYAMERYRERPGLSCWLFSPSRPPCDWSRFPEEIARLGVTGAWLERLDRERAEQLAANGFTRTLEVDDYVLWSRAPRPR